MEQGLLTKTFKGDRAIWGLVAMFMIYSLLAVYSSSVNVAFRSHGGNTTFFLKSQLMMLTAGLIIIIVVHYLPYRIYSSLAGIALIVSAVLLVLTFFFGVRINDATRWLEIPFIGFRIQTSDIAKVALVIYLARTLAKYQKQLKDFVLVTKFFMLPVLIICALIMPENLSTAIMIFGICILIMFIGGVPFKYLFAYILLSVVFIILFALLLWMIREDKRVMTWIERLINFFTGKGDAGDDIRLTRLK